MLAAALGVAFVLAGTFEQLTDAFVPRNASLLCAERRRHLPAARANGPTCLCPVPCRGVPLRAIRLPGSRRSLALIVNALITDTFLTSVVFAIVLAGGYRSTTRSSIRRRSIPGDPERNARNGRHRASSTFLPALDDNLIDGSGCGCYHPADFGRCGRPGFQTGDLKMDVAEPHVRRRGFLITRDVSDDGVESESAEGVPIRIAAARPRVRRHAAAGEVDVAESPAPLDLSPSGQDFLRERRLRLRSASGTDIRLPSQTRH